MSGTAIDSGGGGGGKTGNKKFNKGSRGTLFYAVQKAVSQPMVDKDGYLAPLIVDAFGRLHIKDAQIPDVIEALGAIGITNLLLTTLTEGISIPKPVKVQTKVVSCPKSPMPIPGSETATELDSGDTLGTVFQLKVPTSGVIYSATLFDFDDEGIQIDLEIFKAGITDQATDAAFAPTDGEGRTFLTELAFSHFDDHGSFRTSELNNIGKAYSAPKGKLWIQAVTRGISNIAAGQAPRVQLQILSDDPDWNER